MLTYERRNEICRRIEKNGSVTIPELLQAFDVSAETLRKDLIVLEKDKLLRRIHGGAIPYTTAVTHKHLAERYDMSQDKKRELSRYALQFISNGDYIAIDSGSTAAEFAEVLTEAFTELHIVTYSNYLFQRLFRQPGFDVILCGGKYYREEDCFYGELTLQALRNLHVDKSFLCPAAVSLEFGLSDNEDLLHALQRELTQIADKHYILANSDKIEKRATFRLRDLATTDILITDSGVPEGIVTMYEEKGINIIRGAL